MNNDLSPWSQQINSLLSLVSYDEYQDVVNQLKAKVIERIENRIKSCSDPFYPLPDALQIWVPVLFQHTRIGIQFEGATNMAIYIQQSVEPNGDFNTQIRVAVFHVPIGVSMTTLGLFLGGFLIYAVKKAEQQQREKLKDEIRKKVEEQESVKLSS